MANSIKPAVFVLLLALLIMFIVQAEIAEGAGSGFGGGSSSNSGSGFGSGSSGSSNGGSSSSGSGSGFGSGSSGSSNGGSSSSGGNSGFGGGSSGSGSSGSGSGGHSGSPGCNYRGGVCGDPRIVGGDGVMFYFHGFKDQDFCIVSDSDLHINAHFIGTRPAGRPRDFTWVQALGFVTAGGHKLSIATKRVSKWNNKVDHLLFAYNGAPFSIAEAYGSSWQSPDNVVTVERVALKNSVSVRVREKMEVALTVVPIGKLENKVHNYGINTDEDCFAHFDMQFTFHNLSSTVHGVLGQTYQPGYVNPVKRGVAMPIMGGADRFFSPSLLSTQCRMSQYTATPIPPGSALPGFRAICESSGLHSGVPGGITCRR